MYLKSLEASTRPDSYCCGTAYLVMVQFVLEACMYNYDLSQLPLGRTTVALTSDKCYCTSPHDIMLHKIYHHHL